MKTLRTIGLCVYGLVALAVVGFLALMAWELLANFWALGIGGILIVALVVFTLYSLGSEDDEKHPVS